MKQQESTIERPQEKQPVEQQVSHSMAESEEYLSNLVKQGEWELLQLSPAFALRPLESQVLVVSQAIDSRIRHLQQIQPALVNKGPEERAGAMGVVHKINELRSIKTEMLNRYFRSLQRVLPRTSGTKVEFY